MDVINLLQELNIPFKETHHHVTTSFVGVDCPFCSNNSQRFRMGISRRGFVCSCWTCGVHSTIQTLCELSQEPYHKIKTLLGDINYGREKEEVHRGVLKIPEALTSLCKPHKEYLEHRGFKATQLENLWGIRATTIHPKIPWSIFIPITLDGKVVSWTSRSLSNKGTRYKSASPKEEILSHKSLLFGEDYARHAIIVCEGPFDVFKIGPGAVCTFGTAYTKAQILRISKYPVRVICYDNEQQAQKQAQKLCKELAAFDGKTYRVQLDAKDAGSALPSEICKLRRFL